MPFFLTLQKDRDIETFEMNIKDLTFSQLQKLKMNPVLHGKETYDFDEDESQPHNQPFASFRTVLESVNPECGFNVEMKYPQKKIVRFPGPHLKRALTSHTFCLF